MANHVVLADDDLANCGLNGLNGSLKLFEIQSEPFECRTAWISRAASRGRPDRVFDKASARATRSGENSRRAPDCHSCQQAAVKSRVGMFFRSSVSRPEAEV